MVGSLIEGFAGFAIIQTEYSSFGYKINKVSTALRHIGEIIQPPEKCLIIIVSLSTVQALFSKKIFN
jgi:hypothetical protein